MTNPQQPDEQQSTQRSAQQSDQQGARQPNPSTPQWGQQDTGYGQQPQQPPQQQYGQYAPPQGPPPQQQYGQYSPPQAPPQQQYNQAPQQSPYPQQQYGQQQYAPPPQGQYAPPQGQYGQPGYPGAYSQPGNLNAVQKPTGWFVVNWLLFWPLAIYSLTSAWSAIDPALMRGDIAGAQFQANRVKKYGIIALCVGAGIWLLTIILIIAVASSTPDYVDYYNP